MKPANRYRYTDTIYLDIPLTKNNISTQKKKPTKENAYIFLFLGIHSYSIRLFFPDMPSSCQFRIKIIADRSFLKLSGNVKVPVAGRIT